MKQAELEIPIKYLLFFCAISAALILLFIVLFLVKESLPFLAQADLIGFLTGTSWNPGNKIFGAGIFIAGSLIATTGALAIAIPLGLACAVFLSEVAPKKIANMVRPAVELLAGIPSVILGLFGLIVIVGLIQNDIGKIINGDPLPTGRGLLAVSLILGLMVLPVVISVSQDAIEAVPKTYREGSYALGSTKWQTIRYVVLPAASSGVMAGAILATGRAIGETVAISLLFGNVIQIPTNIVGTASRGETLTATIFNEMGYASVGSPHYSALFALGLTLFIMVFILSMVSEKLLSKGRMTR